MNYKTGNNISITLLGLLLLFLTNCNNINKTKERVNNGQVKDTLKSEDKSYHAFTDSQINFLVSEFKKKYSYTDSPANVSMERPIEIWEQGNKGYVPGISFDSFYHAPFSMDFDNDGSKEIIFTVEETAGGTAAWPTIYCLKEEKDNSLKLIQLDYPCPCSPPFDCQASPKPELIDVNNKNLIIRIGCIEKDDAQCCPSLYYNVTYQYQNDKLMLLGKKEYKE